jgi:hypothetical protein
MEKIAYGGWANCYRLANGIIDLVITEDVGPRIIRLGFEGQPNEFKEFESMMGQTGGDAWRIYGGHRFWHAPEVMPRSYAPDNEPVEVTEDSPVVRVVQPTEPLTGIQKELDITLWPDQAHVTVVHRLKNHNVWTVELAPWALSVMAPGGEAIIPLPPRAGPQGNLLPTSMISLWTYTNMADPRWTWGEKYILLREDSRAKGPQKIGAKVPDGWVGFARNNHLFVKKFAYHPEADYPDWGCCVESYTAPGMQEVETVGPLVHLEPEGSVEYVEDWYLFDGVPTPASDADVERDVLPRVRSV